MKAVIAALILGLATASPQAAAVEGVVRNAEDGVPIAYAEIRVVGDTLLDWTDDRGRYRLEGLPRGEWTIRVVHPGHDSLDFGVVVPGDRDIRLDITLQARPGPAPEPLADFEPFQVAYTLPALLNTGEVADMIQRRYPVELAARGLGGETVLRIWLDERGRVVRGLVSSSSGQPALDSIALAVSDSMRFRPARNRETAVRVIVRMPVLFTVPDSVREAAART